MQYAQRYSPLASGKGYQSVALISDSKNNTPAGGRFFFRMSAAEFFPCAERNLAFGLEPHRRYSESDHM